MEPTKNQVLHKTAIPLLYSQIKAPYLFSKTRSSDKIILPLYQ